MTAAEPSRRTVLIVEPEPHISNHVGAWLVDDGYELQTAENSYDAMQIVETTPPDAIVLDLEFHRADGLHFVRQCHKHPTTGGVPIIVVSAFSDVLEDKDVKSLVYVERPFDAEVLLVLIEDAVFSSIRNGTTTRV